MPNLSYIASWFRKLSGQHRHNYDYNFIYHKYADLGIYKELYKQKDYTPIHAELFEDEQLVGYPTPKDLYKKMGNHSLVVSVSKKPKLEIIVYKTIHHNTKQKLLYHVFEHKIFMTTRLFPYPTYNLVLNQQNKHLSRYLLPSLHEKTSAIYLQDKQDNRLILLDDIQYAEYFVKPDLVFLQFLKTKNKSS